MKNKTSLAILLVFVLALTVVFAVACTTEHQHDYGNLIPDAATCSQAGLDAHYKCDCGKLFIKDGDKYVEKSAEQLMHKTEHKFGTEYVSDADGHWTVCTVCNTASEKIAHAEVDIQSAVSATCTENGRTAGVKCADCGYVITAAEVISALGHDNHRIEAVAATCTEIGNKEYYHCERCDKLFTDADGKIETTLVDVTLAVNPDNHTRLTHHDAIDATVTTDGNIEYWTCICGEYFIDAAGQNEVDPSAVRVAKLAIYSNGTWTGKDAFANTDGGWVVLENANSAKYVISGKIVVAAPVTDGGSRPGLVVAADNDRVYAIAFSNDWIGQVNRSITDLNDWDYDEFVQTKRLEREATLTVARDHQNFYLFIDGAYIKKYTFENLADTASMVGFFNYMCDATFSEFNVDLSEETFNELMLKTVNQVKAEKGTWTETEGSYSNSDGGFKVLDLVSNTQYVVSAKISLTAPLAGGSRPGVVVAANENYALAVAFCDGWLGLARRTMDDQWDVPGGYIEIATMITGEAPECTLTVLRDGKDFYVFVDNTYVSKYSYNVDGDGAGGFFNIGVTAEFSEYYVDSSTETYNTWMSKVA